MRLTPHKVFLIAFFVFVATLMLRFSWITLQHLADIEGGLVDAVTVDINLQVQGLKTAVKDLGVQDGDKLIAVDGVAVRGHVDAIAALLKRPGDKVTLRLQRKTDPPFDVSIIVPPRKKSTFSELAFDYIVTIGMNLFMRWSCLLLGFTVAWRRPGVMGYAFLLMLLGAAQLATSGGNLIYTWAPFFTWSMVFFSDFVTRIFPSAWLWFAVLFPDPNSKHRLFPRLCFFLASIGAIYSLLVSTLVVINQHDAASHVLQPIDKVPNWLVFSLLFIQIALGFANLFHKLRRETVPSMRRRLQWTLLGLLLGVLPIFLLLAAGFLFEKAINSFPDWLLLCCILSLNFIPITLGYAVLVDRIFEIGIFFRQGLIASKTVIAVRVLLVTLIIIAAVSAEKRADLSPVVRGAVIVSCIAGVLLVRRGAEKIRGWVDRRFFQEAVNVEHVLSDLSNQVRRITNRDQLLETVTERLAGTLHVSRVAALIPSNGSFVAAHGQGFSEPLFLKLDAKNPMIQRAADQRHAQLLDAHEKSELRSLGSELLVPIGTSSGLQGILSLGPKLSEEPYSSTDLRLLESVANQTALALENSRLTETVAREAALRERISRELEIAREVQQRLFPKRAPAVPGVEIAGVCLPAQEIGGDYYDFLPTPSGLVGLAIGDVSGKGIPAALLMSALQASLRGLTLAGITDLGDLMTKLNRLIYDATPTNRFATFFYGLYDSSDKVLRFSSAGHNPSLLYRPGADEPVWLRTKGVGLGLTGASQYEQAMVHLQSGDVLVLYTDGVTEARNVDGEESGEALLLSAVRESKALHADGILRQITNAVNSFAGTAPQHDDITVIVMRVV